MSTHKHFDKICCVVLALTLILTVCFLHADSLGVQSASSSLGYEDRLFDTSKVHTINITMEDWDEFLTQCTSEEYYDCTVEIDGETYRNVAIRGKGNTSLTQVASYGNDRYSFKIEFDHYDSTNTYHGLDKLCLNNIIQDNTYMKDFLTYQMMADMGVAAPLCSYTYITVNGEDWGLYLAVEGVETSFLRRNYGNDYSELYKPDGMNMGGGRGNGKDFNMDDFMENAEMPEDFTENIPSEIPGNMPEGFGGDMPEGMPGGFPGGQPDEFGGMPPEGFSGEQPNMDFPGASGNPNENTESSSDNSSRQDRGKAFGGGMMNGSDDVLLKYIDDNTDSYSNIFDSAKTSITESDKTRLIASLRKLSAGEDLEDTVDIETVIRYFVVHNFVLNFDSYTGSMIHNYYLYEEDGQLQMIPWDYNLAFGGFQSMGNATELVNYPIDSPVSGGDTSDRPMIAWIFQSEEYVELYHQYFEEFISEYFESGYFAEMIDQVTTMIAPYVEKDPTKFCTYEEFETGAATLREFCLLRAESIRGQLNGTIGSTSDTQDSSSLIDAGDLQISDMGSMGNMGGGSPGGENLPSRGNTTDSENNFPSRGGFRPGMGAFPGDSSDNNEQAPSSEEPLMPSFGGGNRGENGSPIAGRFPNDMSGMSETVIANNGTEVAQSLIVSIIILAIGLGVVLLYRRRR